MGTLSTLPVFLEINLHNLPQLSWDVFLVEQGGKGPTVNSEMKYARND